MTNTATPPDAPAGPDAAADEERMFGLPYKWLVVIAVIFGVFMAILDATVVNIALVKLQAVFGVSLDVVQWVITAYSLAITTSIPFFGYLAERFGIKRIYLSALAIFTLGSALSGLAWSFGSLITFRMLQGLGSGAMLPLAIARIFAVFPYQERGRAAAFIGIPVLVGPAFGPVLGGYIVEYINWRLIFYLNVPIGIVGLMVGWLILRQGQVKTQESLDTILARATAKSFLITLTRPDLAGMLNFYLSDRVKDSHILAELREPPVTGFEITGGEWVSEGIYRVKAVLQPGNREIAIYIGNYAGQWLVENIERLPAPASTATPTPAGRAAASPAPVSGNGPGFLVFQTQSGGDIYFIKADGAGLRRLTHGIDPQLSPDGTQVAFTRWDPEYELFIINVDGSGEQSIAQGWREMKSPTWSADGTRLVFSYQSGGQLEDKHVRINLEKEAIEGKRVRIPGDARNVEVKNGILTYIIPMDAHWYLKQITPATGAYFDPAAGEHAYAPSWFPTDPKRLIYQGRNGLTLNYAGVDERMISWGADK